MPPGDWQIWMWTHAQTLFREAEKIHWSFLEAGAAARSDPLCGRPSWGPPVNIVETAAAIWVVAGVPGVAAEDIAASLEGDTLVLAGRRALTEEWTRGPVHVLEMPFGAFERRVKLPASGRFELGEVRLARGLLFVEVRKSP